MSKYIFGNNLDEFDIDVQNNYLSDMDFFDLQDDLYDLEDESDRDIDEWSEESRYF